MKKNILMLLFSVSLFSVISGSHAGMQIAFPVVITPNAISGSFGSVRNSANGVEYLYYMDNGTTLKVYAQDAAGNSASCVTADPAHFALIRGSVDTSYYRVLYDGTGTCTTFTNHNGSLFEPKQ